MNAFMLVLVSMAIIIVAVRIVITACKPFAGMADAMKEGTSWRANIERRFRMTPIKYNKPDMMNEEFVAENGTHYAGEYLDMRIQRESIPKGKYAYDCRHGDDGDWVTPVSIEKNFVLVNFAGMFITDYPIDFGNKNYIPLKEPVLY